MENLSLDWVAIAVRVVHVGSGILAAGGAFFQLIALHPSLAALEPESRKSVREAVASRWRGVVFTCIALLLISGLIQFMVVRLPELRALPSSAKGLYHGLFGLKVLAALGSFHCAAVLALPGAKGARYRENAGFWLRLMVTMLTIVILVGAVLRNFKAVG